MKGPFVPGTWWPGTAPPPASSRKWAGAGRARLSQHTKAVCAQRQPAAPSAGRHPAPRATAPRGTPVSRAGHPPTRDPGHVPLRVQVGVCACVRASRCVCGHVCVHGHAASQVSVCVSCGPVHTHVCGHVWLQGCLPATVATRPLLYLLQPRGSHEAPCCPQGSRAILNSPNDALGTVGRCGDFCRNRGRTGEKPEGVALANVAGLVTVVLEWGQRGPEHGRAGRLQGRSLGNGDPGQPGGPLPHRRGHAARAASERRGNGLRPDSQAAVTFPGCFADPGAAVHAHARHARFWGSRPGLRATPTDSH